MICCWLIEVEGYNVREALDAFKDARPNGIRHVSIYHPCIFVDG